MSSKVANANLATRHEYIARVHAATSAIARVFPNAAEAIVTHLAMIDPADLRELAVEAESLQATLILGAASTPNGNSIPENNLHTLRRQFDGDATGAVKVLRDEREKA